uniref:Heparan-sulfate 6-O-sulfotransferase n=1 Tax=Terrapene triunguis TaxID=2587831 RepID=A0A674KAM5_9SAUR
MENALFFAAASHWLVCRSAGRYHWLFLEPPGRDWLAGGVPPRPEEGAAALPRLVPKFPFARAELCRRVQFDMRGRDVIVFLHIQKTGGTTFGRHLVRNIRLEQPCYCRAGQKKCTCHRPGGDKDTWLFSRFSTGWSCGLHADWTELTSCVPAAMERRGCPGNRTLRSKDPLQCILLLRNHPYKYLSKYRA